jgi:hypothetical protein
VRNQREQVAPAGWFTQDLHGITSQKMAFFIVTAVKTSNLTTNFPFTKLKLVVFSFIDIINRI